MMSKQGYHAKAKLLNVLWITIADICVDEHPSYDRLAVNKHKSIKFLVVDAMTGQDL